jgi:type IV secretion system protein VirB11
VSDFNKGKFSEDANASAMLDEYLLPLGAYLTDKDITEIAVNRPGQAWTESSQGWQMYPAPDLTFGHCMQLAVLIASYNNKAISAHKPIMSASLPTGQRVQVLMPPACEAGTVSITVRNHSDEDKTLEQLEAEGAFSDYTVVTNELESFEHELLKLRDERRIPEFLDLAVTSRRNILIVGKTGSGKTTVAKSLIQRIPASERLVTIEDVHELRLRKHENKVHLFFSREGEGSFKVMVKDALASCLRIKPDRILLAELRGDEAWEYAKSVRTGHPGSISTAHANSAREAFDQLTSFIKDSATGAHLDAAYIKHILYTTIDIVLYYDKRKLREIYYEPEFKREQLAA